MRRLSLSKYTRGKVHGGGYGSTYGGNFLSWMRNTGRRFLSRLVPHAQNIIPALIPAIFSDSSQERKQARELIKEYGKRSIGSLIDEGINVGRDAIESGIDKLRGRLEDTQARAFGQGQLVGGSQKTTVRKSKVLKDEYEMKQDNGHSYKVSRLDVLANKLNSGQLAKPIGSSPLNPDDVRGISLKPKQLFSMQNYIPGNTASYFSPTHYLLESSSTGTFSHFPGGIIHDDLAAIQRMQEGKDRWLQMQGEPVLGGSIASSVANVNKKLYAQENPKGLGSRTTGRHKEENPLRTKNSKRSNTSKTTRSTGRLKKADIITVPSSTTPSSIIGTIGRDVATPSVVSTTTTSVAPSTTTSVAKTGGKKGGRSSKKTSLDDFVKTARNISFE